MDPINDLVLAFDAYDNDRKDADGNPRPLFFADNFDLESFQGLIEIAKKADILAMVGVGEEDVISAICGGTTSDDNPVITSYTKLHIMDEIIGIIYPISIVVEKLESYVDTVKDGKGERIVIMHIKSAMRGPITLVIVHAYNRQKTEAYENSILDEVKGTYGQDSTYNVIYAYTRF